MFNFLMHILDLFCSNKFLLHLLTPYVVLIVAISRVKSKHKFYVYSNPVRSVSSDCDSVRTYFLLFIYLTLTEIFYIALDRKAN